MSASRVLLHLSPVFLLTFVTIADATYARRDAIDRPDIAVFRLCVRRNVRLHPCPSPTSAPAEKAVTISPAETESDRRARLDKTVWADEVEAQRYESVIVALWDRLRDNQHALETLKAPRVKALFLPEVFNETRLSPRVRELRMTEPVTTPLDADSWALRLSSWQTAGYELIQSEWHHSRFVIGKNGQLPRSEVSFQLHLRHPQPERRWDISGTLQFEWEAPIGENAPGIRSVRVLKCTILEKTGEPAFTNPSSLKAVRPPCSPCSSTISMVTPISTFSCPATMFCYAT